MAAVLFAPPPPRYLSVTGCTCYIERRQTNRDRVIAERGGGLKQSKKTAKKYDLFPYILSTFLMNKSMQ